MKLVKSLETVVVQAPAKLNLYLRVLGKRNDGFHELQTLICPITLADTLTIRQSRRKDSLSVIWADGNTIDQKDKAIIATWNPSNLIVRAVELFRAETGMDQPVQIRLVKRIPARAGLGGGSSDAAAVLRGLNQLYNLRLSTDQLTDWAAKLGSDVPCFLYSGLCLCSGRGERIQPLGWIPRLDAVVVFPQCGLATAEVYRHWQESEQGKGPEVRSAVRAWYRATAAFRRQGLFNSLEPAALRLCPRLQRLKAHLESRGFRAGQLSGSGSAYFVLCGNRLQARRLARRLAAEGWGNCWAVSTTA